jgi:hypothetical protein
MQQPPGSNATTAMLLKCSNASFLFNQLLQWPDFKVLLTAYASQFAASNTRTAC